MATFALVIDGLVCNLYRGAASADDFPAIRDRLVQCDDTVKINWLYRDGSFVDPETLVPAPTARQLRRKEYFETLKVEPTDDQITVLGDQVDKLIAQVYAIVPANQRTPEFADLIAKIAAVKQKYPKAAPPV